jgi:hypothetical protein
VADKADPPVLAPEFAVGYDPQADTFLQSDNVRNGCIFDRSKRGVIDRAGLMEAARFMNGFGAKETANYVDAQFLACLTHDGSIR